MRLFLGLFILSCLPLSVAAESIEAKVIAVLDGDTVLIARAGHKPEKVRMLNIDAPEKDQAYGAQSKQSLAGLVLKKKVRVEIAAHDQYGRLLGQLYVDGNNINEEQVKRGMAWEYSGFHSNRGYIALQSNAQQSRLGLWAQREPQAPWQWRKLHASHPPEKSPPKKKAGETPLFYDAACGRKTRCSQMHSCDEAHFYLVRCAVKTLDRNHDGVPCESLCNPQPR